MYRFILKLIRRPRLEEDLNAELRFHQEMSEASVNPIGWATSHRSGKNRGTYGGG